MSQPAVTEERRPGSAGTAAPPAGRAAQSGLLAAAAGIGVAELVGGLLERVPSLVLSVGDAVIDSVPGWLERAAIAALGSNDKPVLLASIVLVAAGLGAGTGLLARYRFALGAVAFVLVTALGVAAGLATADVSVLGTVLTGLLAAAVGVAVLHRLLAAAAREAGPDDSPGTGRRGFLLLAAGAAAVAVAGGVGGWLLTGRERLDAVRAAIRLPRPARPAPPPPAGADLDIPGLTSLYVPNERFYRIDTALRVPAVDPADWRLEVTGLVDEPFSLTYDELMAMPQIEADVTLACVSNEVGGDLVGNARWQGVPLRALLERAGVQRGATQLLSRSVDGFTAGFPTVTALDLEEAMVAVAMNGEPLPAEHGFPARLVVPGLYGYVSATKWLSSIELTGWDVDGYWVPRGWAKEGPVKTQSRIDVPRPGGSVSAGRQPIAGVAWAPTRGIEGVEVRIDDGPWQPAVLAEQLDVDCWRQWHLPWDATPGRHVITARATDGAGERQTGDRTPVAPDGASGYPEIEVDVQG